MSRIYTRTGDDGTTALFGGGRVSKASSRVEAYGTVDELNAWIGRCLPDLMDGRTRARLEAVQHDLFALGAALATPAPDGNRPRPKVPDLPVARIQEMEDWIDEAWAELPPLRTFVLPGGTPGSAGVHVARTVCRRAERALVRLAEIEPVEEDALRYLNRLSDALFALARLENLRAGVGDVPWQPQSAPDSDDR